MIGFNYIAYNINSLFYLSRLDEYYIPFVLTASKTILSLSFNCSDANSNANPFYLTDAKTIISSFRSLFEEYLNANPNFLTASKTIF